MTASVTHGRALRYAEGSARGLLHHHQGHCPEKRLGRFYDAMEDGAIDPSEPTFKERLAALTEKRNLAKADEERALAELQPTAKLTEKP
ncbi:hypothetical protein [Maliponia aquimaris]|uniref:Uncharacterized protein n=1 Tax=Maliponia aquimaris TaxID=1673631 RepID=A0A238KMD0_9RHOB|nr:hypothetical protein [Maliponia aquimaris]SMX43868.1 hypothetical protein MAA8898_02922 [Maliponia aquimaris]